MFFPIGDDQIKGGAYPFFSYTFLVLNIVVFLYQMSLTPEGLRHFPGSLQYHPSIHRRRSSFGHFAFFDVSAWQSCPFTGQYDVSLGVCRQY